MTPKLKTPQHGSGEINASTVYTLQRFMEALSIGKDGVRTLRKRGLPIKYIGSRGYVCGVDAVRFFESAPGRPHEQRP